MTSSFKFEWTLNLTKTSENKKINLNDKDYIVTKYLINASKYISPLDNSDKILIYQKYSKSFEPFESSVKMVSTLRVRKVLFDPLDQKEQIKSIRICAKSGPSCEILINSTFSKKIRSSGQFVVWKLDQKNNTIKYRIGDGEFLPLVVNDDKLKNTKIRLFGLDEIETYVKDEIVGEIESLANPK